ncbi:EfeM/EfeO family lipoprotein, partial [Streptomyces longwoodensis]|uniref:EfeM/EfeO family lipoprotein n=1 Tax=Streptomyces longwoodensis TaxID=68231 RepID=UPI0033F3C018
IALAAGDLGYGRRDHQEGGVLPGKTAYAVDLAGSIDAGSWYSTLIQGVFNLMPTMTWLQVVAYVAYLAVVMTLFVRGVRVTAPKAKPETATQRSAGASGEGSAARKPAAARRRPVWVVPATVVAVPAVVAGLFVALGRPKPAGDQTVAVSETDCGKGFTAPEPGRQTFQMHNTGRQASEVYLVDPSTNAVYGEIEGLAPGTTRDLVATIAGGTYAWRCVPASGKAVTSKAVTVTGGGAAKPVAPVSEQDLAAPLKSYKSYVGKGLDTLAGQTRALQHDIEGGHLDRARTDWLTAHRTYASLGAAYGTFEDFDKKIDGRADGLPGGERDKDFSGFLRLEYGLWHGRSAKELTGPARQLSTDVAGL